MILIAGATGMLGSEICRLLTERGVQVRAMVRDTSDQNKVEALRTLGAEIVTADLKEKGSLDAACRGVDAVISTANSMQNRQPGDDFESVDKYGQIDLVSAALTAGVSRFVFVSIPAGTVEFPLSEAKNSVEQVIKTSGMMYTILKPTMFMEVWLSPALGFDPANGTARIYGSGENRISWISYIDVARFAVESLDNPAAENAVIELGGPEALSPLEVVSIVEQTTGRELTTEHIPADVLREQWSTAIDPLQKTFTGLMLFAAGGNEIPMELTLQKFPVSLTSVRDYASRTLS
ncbi:MAG: SDR family oxidoreductase [Pyrinomonadaceae bacterium]